ncbi:MAG: DUF3488 and transglutaminase-like domain-containing protein, partial [Protaetiibacter sp.]
HVTLAGLSWWFVGAGYAAAVLVAAAATRSLLRSPLWPPLVSLAAGVGLLTLGYAADTAILGVIPTLDTVGRMGLLVESGIASIVEQRVPATPELGIVLLIAVLMIACAWVTDVLIALRRPALVAGPLAALLVVPMAIRPELTDAFWYLATAVLYLAVLRIGARRDSRRVVFVAGAVVAVGSLLLPYAIPGVRDDASVRSSGLRTGVNPLITLGDDLRRGDPTLALSYTTDATGPVYLRLTTLDNFTGETWGPTVGPERAGGLGEFPAPVGFGPEVRSEEASVDVTVADLITHWLPLPYPTTSVEGAEGDWFWEPDGLTVRSVASGARGQQYEASFLEVNPTAEQLAETAADPASAPAGSLSLPDDVPEIISATAHEVADGVGSAYAQALALQSYLRGSPFEYSEDTPVEEGFDGSGMDALAVFLDVKSGYCVHYASAMAVMARVLGIPSRVAVGFQPGDREEQRSPVFQVSTNDLHAWPELYFEGIGWLRFEPTPGRGSLPQYGTSLVDDPNTPQDESTQAPTSAPSATPDARPDRDETPQTPEQLAAQQSGSVLAALGVLAALVLIGLVPAAFRTAVRWGRVRRMRQGRDAATAAWDEVRDTARDIGWSAPDSETARAFADRLARQITIESDALGAFRGRVEGSAYGRPEAAAPSPAELAAVRRVILRSAGTGRRVRAFLLPPSLLYRWRPDER